MDKVFDNCTIVVSTIIVYNRQEATSRQDRHNNISPFCLKNILLCFKYIIYYTGVFDTRTSVWKKLVSSRPVEVIDNGKNSTLCLNYRNKYLSISTLLQQKIKLTNNPINAWQITYEFTVGQTLSTSGLFVLCHPFAEIMINCNTTR